MRVKELHTTDGSVMLTFVQAHSRHSRTTTRSRLRDFNTYNRVAATRLKDHDDDTRRHLQVDVGRRTVGIP